AGCHRLGIHTDVSESWDGIHFIYEDAELRCYEEVDSGHPIAAEYSECLTRQMANAAFCNFRQFRGHTDSGAIRVDVLGFIAVKAVTLGRDNLSRSRHKEPACSIF